MVANSHRPTSDQFDDLQRADRSAARQKTTNDTAEVVYFQPTSQYSARATKTITELPDKKPFHSQPTIALVVAAHQLLSLNHRSFLLEQPPANVKAPSEPARTFQQIQPAGTTYSCIQELRESVSILDFCENVCIHFFIDALIYLIIGNEKKESTCYHDKRRHDP